MEDDNNGEGSGVHVLWILVRRDGSASGFAGGGDGGGFFSFFLFFCCGWCLGGGEWMWMWRCLFAVIFFSIFVSGGCGMGGGFLVGTPAVF